MNSHHREEPYCLCSPEYLHFMEATNQYYPTEEALFEAMADVIKPLAKAMHIGLLKMHLEAPSSMLAPNGQISAFCLYDDGGQYASDGQQIVHFETPEKGFFYMTAMPETGYVWSEMELRQLRLLGTNIFTLGSRTRMYKLLMRAYTTDYMTSAMNPQGLQRHGAELKAHDKLTDYVGIFTNLKNFKYINSTVGQRKGDQILIAYCHTIQEQLTPDEKFARPGGDNFFALIRKERAKQFLDFIRDVRVDVPLGDEIGTFHISCHAGVYDITPADDISAVMNYATVALNFVKHAGLATDQMWYDSSLQDKALHDKSISQLFPEALRNKEFLVYYQPKVSLDTKALCGCEALVRWFHNGKIIPPMEFIPVLEKEGTVCSLDFYVFEQVCCDLRKWLDSGIEPVRVSANFSQQHLHNENLAENIVSIMQKYQIDSRYIEIELTELSGAKNHDAMMIFLRKMRECGICTSIDDFGTGYSSLNMLREFHMDIIKLDKSFVDGIAEDNADYRTDEIVIENIVHMAQSLNLEIISEGVETAQQAEFLKNIHCNMAQGYLFDRPLPHDEFEKRLMGSRVYQLPAET